MNRDELLQLRKDTLARVERMRKEGDYSAGAFDSRANTEALLYLIDLWLERMKG